MSPLRSLISRRHTSSKEGADIRTNWKLKIVFSRHQKKTCKNFQVAVDNWFLCSLSLLFLWLYSLKVRLELSETRINTTEWFPLEILTSDKTQVPYHCWQLSSYQVKTQPSQIHVCEHHTQGSLVPQPTCWLFQVRWGPCLYTRQL